MIVGLRGVTAEEYVSVVVDRGNFDARLAQDVATVAASRSPEGIEDDLDVRVGDGLEIDELAEPLQETGLYVFVFKAAVGRIGVGDVYLRCWH